MVSIPGILIQLWTWQRMAAAVGLLAVWWAFASGKERWLKFRTRGWPTVAGPIGEILVEKVYGGPNGVDYWKLTFHFKYRVEQDHSGEYSINLVTEKLRDGAKAGLEGKSVTVHYDPKDEAKAVLWYDEVWDLW